MKQRMIAFAAAVCLLFSGCAPITLSVEELMRPPQLSESQRQVHDALVNASGTSASNISLRYPRSGGNRSAFAFRDLDGDGLDEAMAFYSLTEDPEEIYINIMRQNESGWYSVFDMPGAGTGVESVEFSSVSRGDERDIIIGWTSNETNVGLLSVLRFENDRLKSLYQNRYTSYTTADLNDDGLQEILTATLSSTGDFPYASLICHKPGVGLTDVSVLPLNVDMTSFSELHAGWVSPTRQGLLVDGFEGQDMTSELLFIRNNQFSLPYAQESDFYTRVTRRSGEVYSRDIDADGIAEIPVQRSVPGKTGQYFTDYCCITEDLQLQPVGTAFVNDIFGYTFFLPEEWQDKVTVLENEADEIVFARYDHETETVGRELLRIRVYSEKDYQDKFDIESYHKIGQRGNFRYYVNLAEDDSLAIEFAEAKELFEIM